MTARFWFRFGAIAIPENGVSPANCWVFRTCKETCGREFGFDHGRNYYGAPGVQRRIKFEVAVGNQVRRNELRDSVPVSSPVEGMRVWRMVVVFRRGGDVASAAHDDRCGRPPEEPTVGAVKMPLSSRYANDGRSCTCPDLAHAYIGPNIALEWLIINVSVFLEGTKLPGPVSWLNLGNNVLSHTLRLMTPGTFRGNTGQKCARKLQNSRAITERRPAGELDAEAEVGGSEEKE
ncbi:hypothetical protein B0H16DRAFT_1467634 [Mycena metata]|uniref:Uncharacterized protein n=1 Tax=Mycena metata TaxID=1033252 RepID=A0AAD7I3N2_9AGAR|nr:hypothetical protein B0H16DRAFT_1467634 [Mycena metata]